MHAVEAKGPGIVSSITNGMKELPRHVIGRIVALVALVLAAVMLPFSALNCAWVLAKHNILGIHKDTQDAKENDSNAIEVLTDNGISTIVRAAKVVIFSISTDEWESNEGVFFAASPFIATAHKVEVNFLPLSRRSGVNTGRLPQLYEQLPFIYGADVISAICKSNFD